MREIRIHCVEIRPLHLHAQQRLTHADERRDPPRREVEAAYQFLPTRLGGIVQFPQGLRRALALIGGYGGSEPCVVGAEPLEQHDHEAELLLGGQGLPSGHDVASDRHARCFAVARQ